MILPLEREILADLVNLSRDGAKDFCKLIVVLAKLLLEVLHLTLNRIEHVVLLRKGPVHSQLQIQACLLVAHVFSDLTLDPRLAILGDYT